jgi:hypothetical protein
MRLRGRGRQTTEETVWRRALTILLTLTQRPAEQRRRDCNLFAHRCVRRSPHSRKPQKKPSRSNRLLDPDPPTPAPPTRSLRHQTESRKCQMGPKKIPATRTAEAVRVTGPGWRY